MRAKFENEVARARWLRGGVAITIAFGLLAAAGCLGPGEGRATHQPITGVDQPRGEVAPTERPGDRGGPEARDEVRDD